MHTVNYRFLLAKYPISERQIDTDIAYLEGVRRGGGYAPFLSTQDLDLYYGHLFGLNVSYNALGPRERPARCVVCHSTAAQKPLGWFHDLVFCQDCIGE